MLVLLYLLSTEVLSSIAKFTAILQIKKYHKLLQTALGSDDTHSRCHKEISRDSSPHKLPHLSILSRTPRDGGPRDGVAQSRTRLKPLSSSSSRTPPPSPHQPEDRVSQV